MNQEDSHTKEKMLMGHTLRAQNMNLNLLLLKILHW